MLSREGRYYRTLFKGFSGVTQGDLLSLTIFNMVVDTVICHRLKVVSGKDTRTEGFGRAV